MAYQPPWLLTKIPGPVHVRPRAAAQAAAPRAAGAGTFLLDRVIDDIDDRVQVVTRQFSIAAEIGTPRAGLQGHRGHVGAVIRMDLGEFEVLPFRAGSLDLVVSALAFQFANDLPGVLAQIRRALQPDGLLLAAMLGGETLAELRASFAAAEAELDGGASPRVAPFAELRDSAAFCSAPASPCR